MSAVSRRTRRVVASLGAGCLAFSGTAIAFSSPASAVTGFELDRLQGVDRWATAAAIARASFPDASVVLLANGQSDDQSTTRNEGHFPDALAGNYLAGARSAPTLLTTETSLPGATLSALDDIDPETVIILGGTAAVSAAQESQLERAGYDVQRVDGQDRYETAAAVAKSQALTYVGTVDGDRTAVVASGVNYPDALVAGPLGYAGKLPLMITDPAKLSAPTRDALRDLDIDHVLVPGGPAAVSESVATEIRALGITVDRFAGGAREETATLVADYAVAELGFVQDHVNLASGADFPDALTGGPHAGKEKAPILLTPRQTLSSVTRAWIEEHSDTLEDGHIFGGTAAIAASVEAAAEEAGQGDGTEPEPDVTVTLTSSSVEQGKQVTGSVTGDEVKSATVSGCGLTNEPVNDTSTSTAGIQFAETIPATQPVGSCTLTFTVTFTDNSTETITKTITVTAPPSNQNFTISPDGDRTSPASSGDEGRIEFTVSGIDASITSLDIALVPCENVSRESNKVSFRDTDAAPGRADGADATTNDTPANIETINGQANNSNLGDDEFADDVPVTNGTVKFTVDSSQGDCVVAVAWADADGDDALDVDSSGKPTEKFAATGALTFQPPAAGNGELDEDVQSTDKANDRFVGCEITFPTSSDTGGGAGQSGDERVSSTDCKTFTYDSGDSYYLGSIDPLSETTMSGFESRISPDDDVSGVYFSAPEAVSTFVLYDEAPLAPEAVTVATTSSSVTLTIDDSATPTVDAYNIYRQTSTTGGCPDSTSDFDRIVTLQDPSPNSDESTITYTDNGRSSNTAYCYRVTSVDDGDEGGTATSANGGLARTLTSGTDQVRPRILDAEVLEARVPNMIYDNGDRIFLCVDEPLAAPNRGDFIRVDTDGGDADIENGGNATFALGGSGERSEVSTGTTATRTGAQANTCPGNQTLIITIDEPVMDNDIFTPGPVATGTDIVFTLGVTDVAGNEIDLANSKDKKVDSESGDENLDPQTGDGAPRFAAMKVVSPDTVLVTYNIVVDCASVDQDGRDYLLNRWDDAEDTAPTALTHGDFDVTCAGKDVTFTLLSGKQLQSPYSLQVHKLDNEVVTARGIQQHDSDQLTITAPTFATATTSDGSKVLTIGYDRALDCTTVETTGEDYTLTINSGPGAGTTVDEVSFDVTCSGSTVTLTLNGAGQFQAGQNITLDKVDAEVVKAPNGLEQPDEDAIPFDVPASA